MVHNHYLEEAKKRTQERSRNSEPNLVPSARLQSTANGSKPMPRRNTQTSRNWPATKNSFFTTKTVPIEKHYGNSRNDYCVTKFPNEVNSRAKVPSNKKTNKNKPIEQKGVPYKQERQIPIGHRFSIQKTFIVQKKTMTPRSCLSSELGFHNHNNESSSSKLVPNIVPLKTATSRQELGLLFHHHITMLRMVINQPLPVIAQVSLAGTAQNAPPTLKDPNNKTAKDLLDALERQMCGSEYGEQDRKAAILYESVVTRNIIQNQGDVNDALGYKKKAVVVTLDPLALVAEKTNVSKRKEKVVVYSNFEGSDCKKAKIKDYNYYKTKMLLDKKDSDEQVLLAEDQAWMECSSDSDQEITANMVFMAQTETVLSESDKSSSSTEETIVELAYYTSKFKTLECYDNSTNYGLFVNNNDDQEIFHDAIEFASENFIENYIDFKKEYDESEVDHNDSEEKEHLVDKLIRKFNYKIAKCQKRVEKANQQIKDFENQNKDLQEKYDVLINQEERYEYMIRYSALFDNGKQHRKHIVDQEVLFEKISVELVELDKHVRDLQNTVLEKDFKISELEEFMCNKDLEKEKCLEHLNVCENKLHKMGQTNQTVYMIMPSKDNLYNGRKGISFENPRYFEKAKDLRPTIYDEEVIVLGYTLMFLTNSNEALEIEKFKRSRENKIEFAYDYGNLNVSYVNEKINFEDDYFQEIINPYFKKIDSPFQQTSSLKPYVLNVILEKIIIDLEDEIVSLLEKDKANLETIESLKSKGFESSETAISESENQNENDCHEVEKECDKVENLKVIASGMFKLNLDTFSSVRRPKNSNVIWKKNESSNIQMMCDLLDDNNFFIFDDESVRISPVSQMPFRKKPRDSMNICLWIIDSGCSKHMTGNRALLTNFVEKFLGIVRFGNNDFVVIAGYGDVVIGSMMIKKVYYVEGLGHNLFSVG
nr:integrase, catalytic region, zinc finger, CCHC-type, peptidase aspartic, catalytic [Tanacetum cinerariifolium]